MHPAFNNIGAYLKVANVIFTAAAAAEVDSQSVTLHQPGEDYFSGVLNVAVNAVAGAPTAFSVASKLQGSNDGATWTDLPGAALAPITAVGQASLNVDLSGAPTYVRAVVVPTFTAGNNPSAAIAATLVLGGATELPAV
ncbi:hypothetical protein [Methylovirgula sp. 4M-Z18]|uniref:hypothetical protein n=1 Tax=Methylovirgula sp. 4M-Z18 TaxID=2293567 RepID=UPI000E2E933C|nr:hypothetical protein [Methylovirgula sp. 4M-Z18]RFB80408.1 hypothetical protein DYH55_02450 [Methylovirgula sp. 4M-Z18]